MRRKIFRVLFIMVISLSINMVSMANNLVKGEQKKGGKVVRRIKEKIPTTLVYEAKEALWRGVTFLTDSQLEDGSWCKSPAITGLVCMALHMSGTRRNAIIREVAVEKGRKFILKHVRKDGAIVDPEERYVNYTTAVCLSALAIINNPADKEVMRKARHFLISSQLDEDNKKYPTKKDNPYYGGIGYGSAGPTRPDLSNTQWALEALYLTEYLDTEEAGASPKEIKESKLAWKKALKFLRAVQNLPESADERWIVNLKKDKTHDGGFVYKPGSSKVNEKYNIKGGLRSYGSMTYAGLKSMIYAKLKKDDYRVKAAVEWGRMHYTLKENPEMGPEGHFYYLQVFAKAHAAYGDDCVVTPDGKKHNWRVDLIKQLLSMQCGNGSWTNKKSSRWMESIPELVTSYAMISLEVALAGYK